MDLWKTYVVTGAVNLVRAVFDGVVALRDTVVVFSSARHDDSIRGCFEVV